MTKATISSKRQIAIPKSLRERLDLKPGTQVEIDIKGESLVMRKLASNRRQSIHGLCRHGCAEKRPMSAGGFAAALAQKESAALITGGPELMGLNDVLEIEWIGLVSN